MKLETWRRKRRLSYDGLAKVLDQKHGSTVARWCTGDRTPNAADMTAIFRATGGAVEPNDFYELPPLGQ